MKAECRSRCYILILVPDASPLLRQIGCIGKGQLDTEVTHDHGSIGKGDDFFTFSNVHGNKS